MTELKTDDLKCCGNCEYFIDSYTSGNKCQKTWNTKCRTSESCDGWELDSVIWERIYNRLPKMAEPITVSEEEYDRMFGALHGTLHNEIEPVKRADKIKFKKM